MGKSLLDQLRDAGLVKDSDVQRERLRRRKQEEMLERASLLCPKCSANAEPVYHGGRCPECGYTWGRKGKR